MVRKESTVSMDFINAKVHGMRAGLYERERLLALTDCRSLPELFRRILPGETFGSHIEFERRLLADAVRQLDQLDRFLHARTQLLFEWLLTEYLLDHIKVALRLFGRPEGQADAQRLIAALPKSLSIDLDRLFEAPDLRRFAEAIPVPEFQRVLRKALAAGRPDMFELDTALDRTYMERLLEIGDLGGDWPRKLIEFEMSRRSLLMLLRGRFNFNRSYEQLKPLLMLVRPSTLAPMCEHIHAAPDLPRAIELIPDTLVPREARHGVASLQRIEDALLVRQYRLAALCFAQSALDEAIIAAFYYIKRIETLNLVRLTESVRHSVPQADIVSRVLIMRA